MDGSENVKVPTGKLPFTVQLLSNQPARELFLCAETMLAKHCEDKRKRDGT